MFKTLLITSCILFTPVLGLGQEDRMKLTATLDPKEAAAGEIVTLKLKLDIQPGFHTYPTVQTDPKASAYTTNVRVKSGPLEAAGPAKEPKPKEKFEPEFNATVGYFYDPVDIDVPFKVKAGTPAGKSKVMIRINTSVCNDMNCLPFNEDLEFEMTIKGGGVAAPVVNQGEPAANKPVLKKPEPVTEEAATLSSFLGQAVFWGFVSLLTPCVFPMIPITVSYFLKQKQDGNQSLIHALVYTITIVIALSIFTLFFVELAQKLIYHWGTNLFLGFILMFFALSLFGMYEITLPGFLTRMTSSGESKGGYLGTFFMAMTFIIISFSCVAPFVGGFASVSAQERPFLWNMLGAVTFATCFAAPFFLLALFPSMLKKLPKSGSWMNSLKVVLGILEVAAALKFLRQSELNYKGNNPEYLTYDVVMSMYVGLSFVAGLYLFKAFRMPHDHEEGHSQVGVGRFLWGCVFISLGIYLFPSLFRAPDGHKLRPAGEVFAWVDSFLLQGDDTKPISIAGNGGAHTAELKWFGFLNEAIADAKSKKRRIFIDFTGINCTNCTKNEKAIFSQADVTAAFKSYTLLKLYTDSVPQEYYPVDKLDAVTVVERENDGDANRIYEKKRFNTTELPFYVIVEPDDKEFKEIARYSIGLIRDKEEFLKLLRDNVGKK